MRSDRFKLSGASCSPQSVRSKRACSTELHPRMYSASFQICTPRPGRMTKQERSRGATPFNSTHLSSGPDIPDPSAGNRTAGFPVAEGAAVLLLSLLLVRIPLLNYLGFEY